MTNPQDVFLNQAAPKMRRYEVLRARNVHGCSTAEAARLFGYSLGNFRNFCSAFLDNPDWAFFEPRQPDPEESPPRPCKALRDGRIFELRDQRALSVQHNARILMDEGIDGSVSTVANVLRVERAPGSASVTG